MLPRWLRLVLAVRPNLHILFQESDLSVSESRIAISIPISIALQQEIHLTLSQLLEIGKHRMTKKRTVLTYW